MSESASIPQRWQELAAAAAVVPDGVDVAVTVIDIDSGEKFAVAGSERYKAASTIKTLIMAGVARAVDRGKLDLDARIILPTERKVGGSGVLNWLTDGIELPLRDYAWLMMAISDNTASNVCIDAVGIAEAQQVAVDLGLPDIAVARYFKGYAAEPGEPENIVTSDDLAALLAAIVTGTVTEASTDWMITLLADQQFRNRLPRRLPHGVEYIGKTGSIEGYSHDCGVLSGPRGRLAVAALTRGFTDPYDAELWLAEIGHQAARTIA